ncbi:DUF6578 domain-containing protein [Streptomyces sp. NPDC020807]|uniref:DUF6578 domain-containing protein n=1 Tax=Streptomyces sp. NPDC020807 TaxID=3155119 RepID=UPI0033F47B38
MTEMLTVWVDGWQMECCGESFAVGGVVSWTLLRADPEDYADVVGAEAARGIGFREEHHLGHEEGEAVSVEVVAIVEAHCAYAPRPGGGRTYEPVRGSHVLVPVRRAERWVEERPGSRFVGWLVTARGLVAPSEG